MMNPIRGIYFRIRRHHYNFILKHWYHYYTIGGHCGLCGKWEDKAIVPKNWAITLCPECCAPYPEGSETR